MWYYQSQEGNAGQTKRPSRLKDLEDHSIKSLIREVIQNSLDVRLDSQKPVNLKFKILPWSKSETEKFKSTFGEECFSFYKKSYEKAQEDSKLKMQDGYEILHNPSKETFCLIIEEQNCTGLNGSVNGYENDLPRPSNFNSLMRMIDDNETKKENINSGGTWGKGSSVFTFSSSLWMWFSYTEFRDEWEDVRTKEKHRKRFMGRCSISPYYNLTEEKTYLGEGWFCRNGKDVYPYLNETADEFARKIGIDIRTSNYGTTFFVPFFNSFLEKQDLQSIYTEFYEQAIKNWFIPIYHGNLSVTIEAGSIKQTINRQTIRNIKPLKYKLEILDWYYDQIPKKKTLHLETFSVQVPRLKQLFKRDNNDFAFIKRSVFSDLVIRIIDEDEDFENEWDTENKVTLTRNRGMVVNNFIPFETKDIRFECILFSGLLCKSETNEEAKKHLDLYLAYSENPSHNKWCQVREDYPICFLERFDGKSPRPETGVYNLFREIGRILRKFINKEKVVNTSKDICSIFKKLTRLNSQGSSKGGGSLFSMRKIDEPRIDEKGRFLYNYRLISNKDDSFMNIVFSSKIDSLEGEREKDFDILGIEEFTDLEILDSRLNTLSSGQHPSYKLAPRESVAITIRTCPILTNEAFKNLQPLIKATANLI